MSDKVKRGAPEKPDIKLYEHLSEKERMIAGFPYAPGDEQLRKERIAARKLIKEYNGLEVDDAAGRRRILDELLSQECKGKKLFIEAPFRVDYGYNLTFGNNCEVNFDCVFLDCAPITIGKNCLMAPGVHIYAGKFSNLNKNFKFLKYISFSHPSS